MCPLHWQALQSEMEMKNRQIEEKDRKLAEQIEEKDRKLAELRQEKDRELTELRLLLQMYECGEEKNRLVLDRRARYVLFVCVHSIIQ